MRRSLLRSVPALAALALLALLAAPAPAQLLGAQVTGSLRFGSNPSNFFDPATVTIAEPAVEFGFEDLANLDTANFTDTQLIISDLVKIGATAWTMTFSSPAFTGGSISEVSDSFPNGGATAVLVGDTITVTWAGTNGSSATPYLATYNITFDPAPPDTTAPTITASPDKTALWPPNGKLVPVTITGQITDEEGGSGVDFESVAFTVEDEYDQVEPEGSVAGGEVTIDEEAGTYTFTVLLEARRLGTDKNGRTYTIYVTATDEAGNTTTYPVVVTVPHDQGS